MDVLVKSQALGGTVELSLQYSYKDFDTKAYDASVQELCSVEEKLNDVEALNTELNQNSLKCQQLKTIQLLK